MRKMKFEHDLKEFGKQNDEEKVKLLYLEVLREMYENNNPNCDNKEILMDWCLKQAEQGDVLAQFYIGWLYSLDSERQDDARFWLEKADAQGNINAFVLLDKLNISGFIERYPEEFKSPDDEHIDDDELPF
jgi:TPR repeat protein